MAKKKRRRYLNLSIIPDDFEFQEKGDDKDAYEEWYEFYEAYFYDADEDDIEDE